MLHLVILIYFKIQLIYFHIQFISRLILTRVLCMYNKLFKTVVSLIQTTTVVFDARGKNTDI